MPLRTPERSIALVSQYESIGSLLHHYLTTEAKMTVLWQTRFTGEAVRQCRKKPPRVLITSPVLEDASGVELTRSVRALNPHVRILLFAGVLYRDLVHQMISAEVHGIVAAHSPLPTLLTAINVVAEGGCYFDGIAESMFHAPEGRSSPLSSRERSVLRLVAEGLSTKEIASELNICVKTADKFRERIMAKLNLHDAVKLTRYALRAGISTLG